jgi:toxin ParE1/3/4
MAGYRLTNRAEARLAEIYEYSILNWGVQTARGYLDSLHHAFRLLAENPRMGPDTGQVRRGLRRHAHGSHVIYYRPEKGGVVILDVLGERQDPGRNL